MCSYTIHSYYYYYYCYYVTTTTTTTTTITTTTTGDEVPHCSLNICLSDGYSTVATRYRSGPSTQQPPSLYYR